MTTDLTVRPAAPPELSITPQAKRIDRPSAFFWALVLFAVVNVANAQISKEAARKHPSKENAGTVLSHFKALRAAPDVVIMGSSIVRFPFWLSDLKHSANVPLFDNYRWCATLEQATFDRTKRSIAVFDFGIDAAMVSDVYLIAERLFLGKKKPTLIVYGLSPRDLMDNLVARDTDTLVFDHLFDIQDLLAPNSLFQASNDEKVDLMLKKLISLYHGRRQIQEKGLALLAKIGKKLPRQADSGIPQRGKMPISPAPVQAKPKLPNGLINQTNLPPPVSLHNDAYWIRSIAEYEARYSRLDYPQLLRQKRFLEALIRLAASRQIPLLLVNMPITAADAELMPPGLLAQYNSYLRATAFSHNVDYLDLQQTKDFSDQSFFDVVHLNAEGGDQLSEFLTPAIAKHLPYRERQTSRPQAK